MIAPGTPGFLLLCLLGYVGFASTFAYAVMAVDKGRAERGGWRIPEGTLLLLALAGGWPGVKLAQRRLRHKTVKQPFRALLTLVGVVQAVVLAVALVPAAWVQRGAHVAMEVGAPAGARALDAMGMAVKDAMRQVLAAGASGDGTSGGGKSELPKRFGPGSDDN